MQRETKIETGLALSTIPSLAVDSSSPNSVDERLKQVRRVAVSPSVTQREKRIQDDLEKMRLSPNQETVDLLVQHLAVQQALNAAEQTYRTIFGSQIALLKFLNTRGTVLLQELESFYQGAKEKFSEFYTKYSFQQWLHYMTATGLLQSQNSLDFTITFDGKEFLKWMTEASVLEDKPL